MRDRGIIIGGLILFLGLITFPVWYNAAAGTTSKGPEPKLPTEEKACVAPLEYMRTSHMDLLVTWRDEVVRQHNRKFVAFDGKTYTVSLTQTCMKCHASKEDFCDRCHSYAGVTPTCWDCHIDPELARKTRATVANSNFVSVQHSAFSRQPRKASSPEGATALIPGERSRL